MTDHTGGRSLREDLERRLDEYRTILLDSVGDLSEDQAKKVVLTGQPSLLGILRHAGFVEGVWFDEAITGRSRKEIGIPVATANSLKTRRRDSIDSVREEYRQRIKTSRANVSSRDLDDMVHGMGKRYVRETYLQVLSELAWRSGQADILRGLVLQ